MQALFLASTPLHTFLALGLMEGPFKHYRAALALIDQVEHRRDYVGAALQAVAGDRASVSCHAALGSRRHARQVLAMLSALTRNLSPDVICIGNDRRVEFHAARSGCPAARCTYVDDGLYSYLPHRDAISRWREIAQDIRRGLRFGIALERPSWVGGSRAVDDAYVLLPEHVHPRLRTKPVRAIEPAWFSMPWVQDVCMRAAQLAGIDRTMCDAARLVVLLPHPDFLDAHPELRPLLSTLIRKSVGQGGIVIVKGHPKAGSRTPAALLQLPGDGIVEAPPSLPVETMIPLLHDAMVVGTLSTALLTLKMLGRGLDVRSIAPVSTPHGLDTFSAGAQAIFSSAGIRPYHDRE